VQPDTAQRGVDRTVAGAISAAVLVAAVTLALTVVEAGVPTWRAPAALGSAVLLGAGACALVLLGQWLAARTDSSRRAGFPYRSGVPAALREGLRRETGTAPTEAPWRRGAQLGWSVLAVVLEAATLASAVHAAGGDVPLLETLSVYAVLHLLWSLLPLTGTPGAADLVLLLVLTALGAPLASACAAVLAFRMVTFWLPAATGALLVRRFERRLLL
jgi:undecaprenyl-diphosphatase